MYDSLTREQRIEAAVRRAIPALILDYWKKDPRVMPYWARDWADDVRKEFING